MELIEPKVELLSELDITHESHIARCARVCFGREYKEPNQAADKKLVEGLINRGHLSMLRHASVYGRWLVAKPQIGECDDSPYLFIKRDGKGFKYASTNKQYEFENTLGFPSITPKSFLQDIVDTPHLFSIFRLTFCITTQISTSRELNRVSPNNIAERSTRFCTQKDGLEIVKPWWWDGDDTGINMLLYKEAVYQAELNYQGMINYGLKPEDARGILPLDTATKVIYTYSIKEWKHILDLRLYDKTGKAHPNCHVVMQMVKDQINNFAKEHNIDYQV